MDDDKKKIFELEKKISELEEKIFELQEKLKSAKDEVSRARRTTSSMVKKIFELEEKVDDGIAEFFGEEWRNVVGYEGLYQVSNKGRIKSFCLATSHLRKPKINVRGYLYLNLTKKRKSSCKVIHRLVAEAFIPNPENKPLVNHKDGNKLNNCVENLEWVTESENQKHSIKNGLRNFKSTTGEKNYQSKLTNEQVKEIRKIYKSRDAEFGAEALAKKFNVHPGTISKIISGKTYRDIE